MSETSVPTPLERFPPARPPLGPRAPTSRARRTFWALLALAVALTIYVVWPFRAPLFLAAFFVLLVDGRHLIRLLGRISPLQAAQSEELLQEFANVSSATLVGAALTAVVQAVLATIGFALGHVPRPVFLGIATLVASFVPVIGTALIWIPVTALLVLTGHVTAAIFIGAWCGVLLTAADNVVKPLR